MGPLGASRPGRAPGRTRMKSCMSFHDKQLCRYDRPLESSETGRPPVALISRAPEWGGRAFALRGGRRPFQRFVRSWSLTLRGIALSATPYGPESIELLEAVSMVVRRALVV